MKTTSEILKLLGEFLEVRARLNQCCAGSVIASNTFKEMERVEKRLAEAYTNWQQWCRKRDDGPCPECGVRTSRADRLAGLYDL